MRLPFGFAKEHFAGLDISSTAVKFLELGQDKDGYRVDCYAIEPLPEEAVVDKTIQDVDAVGNAVRRAVTRARSRIKHVALAVPGSSVITKTVSMPAALSEDEISEQLNLEADRYIPYPIEEVYLDFDVLGPTEDSNEMVDVLLAASRSENVESRVAAVEVAGLSAIVVDVESYAVERAFPVLARDIQGDGSDQEVVALVDMGAATTTLSVFEGESLVYTREQAFGGAQLEEQIQGRYGLEREEAARSFRAGDLPEDFGPELLEPFKQAMGQQIERALQVFLSSSAYRQVDHVLLGGGCAGIPGAGEAVARQVDLPVTLANPLNGVTLSPQAKPQLIGAEAPTLLTAFGLAMRSFIHDDHR